MVWQMLLGAQLTNLQIAVITGAGVFALLLMSLIGREIFYATNPDRRPKRRKKRR